MEVTLSHVTAKRSINKTCFNLKIVSA